MNVRAGLGFPGFIAGHPPANSKSWRESVADLNVLKESGMDIDSLPAEQREALNKLDDSEVQTLASIRTKLNSDEGSDTSGYLLRSPGIVSTRPIAGDGSLIW